MIQRCKNCGNWVEAEERDAFDRAVNPVDEAFESEGGPMENIGGWFGFKGLGRAIDRAHVCLMILREEQSIRFLVINIIFLVLIVGKNGQRIMMGKMKRGNTKKNNGKSI